MAKAARLVTVMVLMLTVLSAIHRDGATEARVLEETSQVPEHTTVMPEASGTPPGRGGKAGCPSYDPGHCPPVSA